MGSILGVMNIAKSALLANQTALQVTGQNIANVSTPGYSRQVVGLEAETPVSSRPGQLGMGVRAADIRRMYDGFIENEINKENEMLGWLGAKAAATTQVEQVFNESGGSGIGSALDGFFSAVNDLSNNPAGSTERMNLTSKAGTLCMVISQSYSELENTRRFSDTSIEGAIRDINSKASQIASLNREIANAESAQQSANDLRDKRGLLLKDLSGLININTFNDERGQLTVMVADGEPLVEGRNVKSLTTVKGSSMGGGFTEVGFDYGDGTVHDITGSIKSGSIKGYIDVRDDLIPRLQDGLDQLAAGVTNEVNNINQAGYGLDASHGVDFFEPLGVSFVAGANTGTGAAQVGTIPDNNLLSLDTFELKFTDAAHFDITDTTTGTVISTGNIYAPGGNVMAGGMQVAIQGAPAAGDTFYASAAKGAAKYMAVSATVQGDSKKIAAATDPTKLPGDNTNALSMAALQTSHTMSGGSVSFSDYYTSVMDQAGVYAQGASTDKEFHQNLLNNLENTRETVSGVSLDEEITNILKFQRAYQAAAKMITVADELLQSVLGLKQ